MLLIYLQGISYALLIPFCSIFCLLQLYVSAMYRDEIEGWWKVPKKIIIIKKEKKKKSFAKR